MSSASRTSSKRRRPGSRGLFVIAGLFVVAAVLGSLALLQEPPTGSAVDPGRGRLPVVLPHAADRAEPMNAAHLPTIDRADVAPRLPVADVAAPRSLLSSLRGRVVDDVGAPRPYAVVTLRQDIARNAKQRARVRQRRVTADEDARFVFEAVTPGSWSLAGRAEDCLQGDLDFELESGESDRDVEIVLPRACRVEGIVNDTDGIPAAQQKVRARLVGDPSRSIATATSDKRGRFQMNRLRPGSYVFSFRIDGLNVPALPEGAVDVDPSIGGLLEFRVPAPGGLTGRVLFAGTPIPMCRVTFEGPHATATAKTDMDGIYRLTIPMASVGHVVAVRDEIAMSPWFPVEIFSGYTKSFDLRFRDVRLDGRVINAATEEPVPNTLVTFDVLDEGTARGKSFTRRTDKDGRFFADHLYPATWRLTPSHFRFLPAAGTDLVVSENEPTEIALTIREGAAIRGVVRDLEGKPTGQGVRVHLLPRGSREPSPGAVLVSMGKYELTARPAGDYDLIAVEGGRRHIGVERARLEEIALARAEVHLVEGKMLVHDLQMTRLKASHAHRAQHRGHAMDRPVPVGR